MKLLSSYDAAVARGDIFDDSAQKEVLCLMQKFLDSLNHQSWFKLKQRPKGLYLYGSVGIGKTYLIDLLYQQIPGNKKARFHFHHFMQQVDNKLRQIQGQKNPLQYIAKTLASTTSILFFDEFLVHDVAHAMILAEFLQALHRQGVNLVISSNTCPADLYLNGVQRDRFLPVIELIESQCEIIHLKKIRDYRRGRKPAVLAYLYPLTQYNYDLMDSQFEQLSHSIQEKGSLCIQNREIPFLKRGSHSIWFDFNQICNVPRCQSDYLKIAQQVDILFLSGLSKLQEESAQFLLFIYLVDVLYDQGIRLIILAQESLEDLSKIYPTDAFKRTLSRLIEMQSEDYLLRHARRVLNEM
ncbi:MAG: cell division protein ZapE [Legionella sp.]|nr:cell division protein ZapE [Legionella sp.]